MPREIHTWQVTTPQNGFAICPHCEGWGGRDRTVCYGFGGKEDWENCFTCMGSGQIDQEYADYIASNTAKAEL